MTQVWFQVEFLSRLDNKWIPLFGRHTSIESARESRGLIKEGESRIVHITRTAEVVA